MSAPPDLYMPSTYDNKVEDQQGMDLVLKSQLTPVVYTCAMWQSLSIEYVGHVSPWESRRVTCIRGYHWIQGEKLRPPHPLVDVKHHT